MASHGGKRNTCRWYGYTDKSAFSSFSGRAPTSCNMPSASTTPRSKKTMPDWDACSPYCWMSRQRMAWANSSGGGLGLSDWLLRAWVMARALSPTTGNPRSCKACSRVVLPLPGPPAKTIRCVGMVDCEPPNAHDHPRPKAVGCIRQLDRARSRVPRRLRAETALSPRHRVHTFRSDHGHTLLSSKELQ